MTNKEIIIDGVNVAGCEHYDNHTNIYFIKDKGKRYCYDCSLDPDCHYKQIQRKEQECKQKDEYIKLL